MKIIDRDGRLFGKISVIDVLVIAVVAVMAAALYFKSIQTHTGGTISEQTITFQIRAQGVDDFVADAIRVGDSLYDKNYTSGSQGLGEITEVVVERSPGYKLADELTNGTAAMLEAENTVDLLITVRGSGLVTDRSYSINRIYDLGVNSARNYITKRADFIGMVCEIMD